ncbi:MAG: serine/threonine-protein kinase [Acidimicrobiales bacterium]
MGAVPGRRPVSGGTGHPPDLGLDHLAGIRFLGSGGFGAVYAATDTDLDRPVAVKVFHDLREPADLARFDRERKAMGRLTGHPNIVTLYHTGYTAQGHPYLLMELVDGGSLGDRLKTRGPLPWPEAVGHAAAVARALAHAHQRGVLHRDVKPANILIDGGVTKLADFGIARLTDTDRTASGTVLASLAHAAPETFSDRRDERSDVYSLASTVFHLIAGRPPFHRDGDESQMALLHRVVHEPPPRLGPALAPPALDDLLQRALAKDPAHRPATAHELAAELDRIAAAPAPAAPAAVTPAAVTGAEPTRQWSPPPGPAGDPTRVWAPGDQRASPVASSPGPAPSAGAAGRRLPPMAAWALGALAAAGLGAAGVAVALQLADRDGAASPPATTEAATPTAPPSAQGTAAGAAGDTTTTSSPAPVVLTGHSDVVTSVAWLPDGRLASSSRDRTVRVWDPAAPGTEPVVFSQHTDVVWHVTVLADGRLASASWDGTVLVWDPATPDAPALALPHPARVWAVAQLPDGRLATGTGGAGPNGPDQAVRIWDLDRPDAPRSLVPCDGNCVSLAVTADGRLAAGDQAGNVWLLRFPPGGGDPTAQRYTGHGGSGVWQVAALADGRVASAGLDDTAQVWDVDPDRPAISLVHPDDVLSVAVLPDGRIVTGSEDHQVRVWDLDRPDRPTSVYTGHDAQVIALATDPQGRVASGGWDDLVEVWTPPPPP